MAWQVKMLAAKPDNLSSIPWALTVKRAHSYKRSSARAHTHSIQNKLTITLKLLLAPPASATLPINL